MRKLQKEIQEEKDDAVKKKINELTEWRKLITENELAKEERVKKRLKEKEDDAAALIRFEAHLEQQDI